MLTRRRLLQIAAAAPLALAPWRGRAAETAIHSWRGTALGAEASILLHHPDADFTRSVFAGCVREIRRLEKIFSLHDPESALCALNRDGVLAPAPEDLRRLLGEAAALSRASGGAFDCTVQPLWRFYAAHFGDPARRGRAPDPALLAEARRLVNHRAVSIAGDEIRFARPGMAVTLNGIAQGYITDRVGALLRANGFDRVLLDLGEFLGWGRHPDGRPWRVGIADPRWPWDWIEETDLADRALATSGGYGSPFEPSGRHHHLFDPRTGTSADHYLSVSVLAPTATLADGLSTALYATPPACARDVLERFEAVGALMQLPGGARIRHQFG